jgi:magnesium transporter
LKNSEKKPLNLKTITWNELTWVDVVQPTTEVAKYLADNYHFNALDLEDALSPRQLPKIEEYQQYLFVMVHISVFDKVTRVSQRKQWSAFVGQNFLITLRPSEFKIVDELFRECELNKDTREQYLSHGSGYLLYQIFDRAIDRYFRVLEKILNLIEDIEDNVFKEGIEVGREVGILRRDIITQKRVMFPTRTLIAELEKKLKNYTKVDLNLLFSDLMDHMNKICETLDEYTETIEVFKDADYAMSGYRANRTVRILAVLFAVGLPFLVVSSLYLIAPGGVDKDSLQTFLLLLIIIIIFIAGTLYFFRRQHLI